MCAFRGVVPVRTDEHRPVDLYDTAREESLVELTRGFAATPFRAVASP
jgi:hypothetical protein